MHISFVGAVKAILQKQFIQNKINRNNNLLQITEEHLNIKLSENPSILLTEVEIKANDKNYLIQENYDENYQFIGIC
jgi:hypothetical protein